MQAEGKKTCSFFGHGTIYDKDGSLFERLIKEAEQLIESGYTEFLLGGYGDFDSLSHKAVNSLKEKYPHIKTVYVQAYYNPKDKNIEHIRNQYDEIAYPEIEEKSKKFAIVYRNREMIINSDYCIFYVNRSYGGALQALAYVKRKKKAFVNLAE
jgi:uncharacterized phage-like protein YoqJ